ncbi:MAG: hypothetical protein ACOCP8_06050 [archaeon]
MILKYLEESLKNYSFIYALFISAGIGWGLKSGLDKIISFYIVLKTNQEDIKKILEINKKEHNNKFNDILKKLDLIYTYLINLDKRGFYECQKSEEETTQKHPG